MSFYEFIVLIHVIAAVAGLGASFGMPIVMKYPKTASQVRISLDLNKQIEKVVKIGSITLLVTGLVLGIMNPALFMQGWYIASIVIYIAVQFIVAGIMPKKMKMMAQVIQEHDGEEIPDSYKKINGELRPYNAVIHTSAILLIILMSIKPF